MNANDVIRIGRRRMRAGFDGRVDDRHALSLRSCSANSTIRIEFLAARPISMTSPTWQNTSFVNPRSNCALSAPNTASGTPSRMMNGSTQLSYCAASTRYTSRIAQPEEVDGRRSGANFLERLTRPGEVEPGRQRLARQLLHVVNRLAASSRPASGDPVQFGRSVHVEVADDGRRRRFAQPHDRVERHHLAVLTRARSTAAGCSGCARKRWSACTYTRYARLLKSKSFT